MHDDEPLPWQRLSTRRIYTNPWLALDEDVVALPNGRSTIYGVVRCGTCVGMLPFADDDHVWLVQQWRYIVGRATWEMPTGGVHVGETPGQAAQRELAEEIGHRAGRLVPITAYSTSKSVVDETAYLYIAEALVPADATPDDTELLNRQVFPFTDVLDMVLRGEILDSMTIVAVLWADRSRTSPAGQTP